MAEGNEEATEGKFYILLGSNNSYANDIES